MEEYVTICNCLIIAILQPLHLKVDRGFLMSIFGRVTSLNLDIFSLIWLPRVIWIDVITPFLLTIY